MTQQATEHERAHALAATPHGRKANRLIGDPPFVSPRGRYPGRDSNSYFA
jgi:hypothetical protein